jgi:uncharacterized lipoprotein YddW (UPF0748 family)
MKRLVFYLIAGWVCVAAFSIPPKREMRGVWLTVNYALDWPSVFIRSASDTTKQQAELDRMLDHFQHIGINTVFLQTRLRGTVIYPSRIEPVSEYFGAQRPAYDPLAYAIEACHRRGMECHAWLIVYPVGRGTTPAAGKTSQKRSQTVIIPDRYKGIAKAYNGSLYLDPGNPKTTDYLLQLIREHLLGYDVDGIHFDYIRYPDNGGRFPDDDTYRLYGNDTDKASWRRSNINRFVYAAYDTIKALKPWVQVSSSVVGMYDRLPQDTRPHWTARHSVYQDPENWLANGKHDFIVPMMYHSGDLFFPFVDDWLTRSNGRSVMPGLGLYQMDAKEFGWEPEVLLEQIRYSRDHFTQGNVFFRARHLLENTKGIGNEIATRLYATPALLPALSWLSGAIPDAPPEIRAHKSEDHLLLSWDNASAADSAVRKVYYNVYRSEEFPVDVNDPGNLIAARLINPSYRLPIDDRQESGYYYAVTAYDRYHNESVTSYPAYFVTGNFEK